MQYFCCDERRSMAVKGSRLNVNGIDFLEVVDDPSEPDKQQRVLNIHFLKPLQSLPSPLTIENVRITRRWHPEDLVLTKENVRISGGVRIKNVLVKEVKIRMDHLSRHADDVLVVEVDKPGDFSVYTLHLVESGSKDGRPPKGMDPILSSIDFSFRAICESEFDCRREQICPPQPRQEPDLNYLAKDYASFRSLMLDRMSLLLPQWKERNPADLGIVLVELLAYVADCLSYQQDAVATEAYLGTARRRISVRRHSRLLDYFMHDGCNSRVWVQIRVEYNLSLSKSVENASTNLREPIKLLSRVPDLPTVIQPGSPEHKKAMAARPEVFELVQSFNEPEGSSIDPLAGKDIQLYYMHNEMRFYTWGDEGCCLPKGATSATLSIAYPDLKKGDVLILAELRGPNTGLKEDADPAKRHAVRLTEVAIEKDPLNEKEVTLIQWHEEDALPFPLCISSRMGDDYFDEISVAWGNIFLADHGSTVTDGHLGSVPEPNYRYFAASSDRCKKKEPLQVFPRFRPKLKEKPLTHAVPYLEMASARALTRYSPLDANPRIELRLDDDALIWESRRDLLDSRSDSRHFVVEIENDGTVFLRFGEADKENANLSKHGLRPEPGSNVFCTYRIGNGTSGNVGSESIAHIVGQLHSIKEVRNPLPAQGGRDPESVEEVRKHAPAAFRVQERAVTTADYAEVAGRYPGIQRTAATSRWTGSWNTVFLTVDRLEGWDLDAEFKEKMVQHLEKYRMAGQDVDFDGPRYVPLEVEIKVCVLPDYFRSDVKADLLQVFSNKMLPDGRRGLFHPDNFTFGDSVYTSSLYAAAQSVAGVSWVEIEKFQRKDAPGDEALLAGRLVLGRLEVARLDNDRNFPERGVLRFIMEGGK